MLRDAQGQLTSRNYSGEVSMTDFWTFERVEHLRKRWREGASASDIALELGTLRGNVTSKVAQLRKRDATIPRRKVAA